MRGLLRTNASREVDSRAISDPQIVFLLPGTLLYSLAAYLANHPNAPDAFGGFLGKYDFNIFGDADTHLLYTPLLLLAGGNTPLLIEWFLYAATPFREAIPLNYHFTLHRCTELFMVRRNLTPASVLRSPQQRCTHCVLFTRFFSRRGAARAHRTAHLCRAPRCPHLALHSLVHHCMVCSWHGFCSMKSILLFLLLHIMWRDTAGAARRERAPADRVAAADTHR